MAILQRGLESPLLDGFNGAGIKAESQATNYTNVTRISTLVHDQREYAHSLSLSVASLLGIFRIRCRYRLRSGNTSAHLEYASANTATAARTHTRSVTHAHSATRSRANAATRTGSI